MANAILRDRPLLHKAKSCLAAAAACAVISGCALWQRTPGPDQVRYRIPVSGERPMKISVSGLPAGVTFEAEKGILGGVIAAAGDYPVTVTAENAHGRAERVLTLKVGERISLTPPMGWNSWNIYAEAVTDEWISDNASEPLT